MAWNTSSYLTTCFVITGRVILVEGIDKQLLFFVIIVTADGLNMDTAYVLE